MRNLIITRNDKWHRVFAQKEGVDNEETFLPKKCLNPFGYFCPLLQLSIIKIGEWKSRQNL